MAQTPFTELLSFILVNLAILLGWLTPMLIALYDWYHHNLSKVARVVWVLVIILLPIIGPLVFMLIEGQTIANT